MIRHEIRNHHDQGLCGLTSNDDVDAVWDLDTGTVSLWTQTRPPMLQQVGIDPLYEGPLDLVALDAQGKEIARVAVPRQGKPFATEVLMPPEDSSGEPLAD